MLNPLLYPLDLTVRVYAKLIKVFTLMFTSFLNIKPGRITMENTGETSILSFLVRDSRWMLYTQSKMSEGNTAHMEIKTTLDAVKKE